MGITRRIFLKSGAMTVVGMAAVPQFLARAAMAANTAQAHKRLVVIFQRGAADGLNIVVPHGEQPTTRCVRGLRFLTRCDRPGWILRAASCDERAETALGCEAVGDRSCRRIARPDALAL